MLSTLFSFTKLIKFWILSYLTFLTLIFCCSHICEAAGTKLVWDESPEANVTGYYLYYGTKPDIYTNSVQVVGKSNAGYLIEDLKFTPDQIYYIAVTAYIDTGEESTYSNEVTYEKIKPETVTELQSTTHPIRNCSSNREITLQWIAAVDTGGSGLDGYSIVWDTESDTLPDTTKDIENVTTVTSPSLANGYYYFHIRSTDSALNWCDTAEHLGPFCIYSEYNVIPQSQLTIASFDSEELVANGYAVNAIDGQPDTLWHTEWYQSEPGCPHEIVIDLGNLYLVGGFRYLPRQDGNINGTVADYSIYVSKDGIIWGEAVATGTFAGDTTEKEVTFAGKSGSYVRFVAMSEVNENPWTSAAEINVLETVLPADSDGDGIIDDDEIDIYGTDPDKADTDGDGIGDGEEVALWGDDWDADYDSDGIINLLDPDADGDGVSDGDELEFGTDPAFPDTPDYWLIPQSQLTIASFDSEELVANGYAVNAIDGQPDTLWHTEWYQSEPGCPHEIVIDLGNLYLVGGFRYLPRQDGNINGTVADYSIYVSKDGIIWGEAVATGTFAGDTTEKEVTFAGKSGSYVRFVAMSEVNGNPWTSAAEINVLETVLPADSDRDGIIDDDEIDIYGTDPDKADTDGDGIGDGEEVALWGDDWDADYDSDGIINLLDPDADGDGVSDGDELEFGTDPAFPDTPDYWLIPQSQLTIASFDSEELVANGYAVNAIDGQPDTLWHTEWYQSEPTCPHEIVIDLGDIYLVGGFQYLPRQDGGINGTVADYSIYVSKDGIIWGEAVATGTFAGDTTEKEVTFAGKSGSYVRFVAMSEVNGNPWTSAAEINVLGSALLY